MMNCIAHEKYVDTVIQSRFGTIHKEFAGEDKSEHHGLNSTAFSSDQS